MGVLAGWKRIGAGLAAAAWLASARAEPPAAADGEAPVAHGEAPAAQGEAPAGEREALAVAAFPRVVAGEAPLEATARGGGVTVKPRLKLKARLDWGDVRKNADRTAYVSGRDAYVDKLRFGVGGRIFGRGRYALTFETKDLGRTGKQAETQLDRAYAEWAFDEAFAVRFGQATLPLSRGSLLSSNDVFLEDAEVTDAAGKVFFGTKPVHLQVRGRLAGGVVTYHAAIADGWGSGDLVPDDDAPGGVFGRDAPLVVLRAELALPGFTEGLEQGEPGEGRRLSLGASLASQSSIRYVHAPGHEDRRFASADLTARVGPFSGVLEVDAWRVRSTDPGVGGARPWGWYAQAAWYVEALRLEPALRYDRLQESSLAGAHQGAFTLGATWYARGDDAKVAVNWTSRSFGPRADDRLDRASRRDLLEIGGEISFW